MVAGRRQGSLFLARFQRVDNSQMLADRGEVAVALVLLVPLIVVVEDERDHLLEFRHEAVLHDAADGGVEAFIESNASR